jgi:hypothetical protein
LSCASGERAKAGNTVFVVEFVFASVGEGESAWEDGFRVVAIFRWDVEVSRYGETGVFTLGIFEIAAYYEFGIRTWGVGKPVVVDDGWVLGDF